MHTSVIKRFHLIAEASIPYGRFGCYFPKPAIFMRRLRNPMLWVPSVLVQRFAPFVESADAWLSHDGSAQTSRLPPTLQTSGDTRRSQIADRSQTHPYQRDCVEFSRNTSIDSSLGCSAMIISMTERRRSFTSSDSVRIFMPSATGMVQEVGKPR